MRIDPALAVRLERAIGASAADYAKQRAALFHLDDVAVHELRPTVIAVDSGAGGGENSSSVFGLGLDGPVSVDDIEALDACYRRDGPQRPLRVNASPLAHPSLYAALAERGLRPVRFSSLMAATVAMAETHRSSEARDARDARDVRADASSDVRLLAGDDVDALVTIEEACYGASNPDIARRRALPLFLPPCATWAAFIDGAPAACGALVVAEGIGLLFAGMCRPEARGRGLQSTLIRTRMRRAAQLGLDVVASLAAPGSTSERNLRSAGFALVCTTSLWQRAP